MAHHIFRRGALGGGGTLATLLARHDWITLLGCDDESGDVVDATGDGDYTPTRLNLYEAGTSDMLPGSGQSLEVGAIATDRATWQTSASGRGSSGNAFAIYIHAKVGFTTPTWRVFEAIDSVTPTSVRRIVWVSSGLLGYYDGAVRATALNWGTSGQEALIVARVNGTVLDMFLNGIKFATLTTYDAALPGSANRLYAWCDYALGSTNPAYGKHYLQGVVDGAPTDAEIYADWALLRGDLDGTHDWLERPHLQADCIFHAPLFETAGAEACDVSGNENHGTYINGPSLGQTALGGGAVYSVGLNGTTQGLNTTPALVDQSSASFTVSCRYSASASLDVVFCQFNSTADYLVIFTSGADLVVRIYDGTVLKNVTLSGGGTGTHDVVARWNFATLTLDAWLDGVQGATQDATGYSASAPTVSHFGGVAGALPIGLGYLDGNIELPRIYNVAKPDMICAELAGGPAAQDLYDLVVAEGLGADVVYYGRCDDTSSPLLDYSAAGNDMVITGTPTYNTGALGGNSYGGITFGGSQYATVGSAPIDLSTDSCTAVVRFNTSAANDGLIGLSGGTYDSMGLLVRNTGKLVASLTDNVVRTSATIESAASVNDSAPHIAVVRFDRPNATLDLWLDGAHVGQVDVTGQMPALSTATNRFAQGVYNTVTGTPGNLAGQMDQPLLANAAWSDAFCLEISGLS